MREPDSEQPQAQEGAPTGVSGQGWVKLTLPSVDGRPGRQVFVWGWDALPEGSRER